MTNAKSLNIAVCISLAAISLSLTSCFTRRTVQANNRPASYNQPAPITNHEAKEVNKELEQERKSDIAAYVPYTSLTYIERFKAIAIQEMNLYGIPASITLAQGLFESRSGNSELARVANNHFGIKCNAQWQGKSYYKDDDQHNDCFRVYNNAEDSF